MCNDVEKENLQGKVKSVTEIAYLQKEKKGAPTVCKTIYSPQGYMIGYEELYDADDSNSPILFKQTIIRNKADNIIESFFINAHTCEVRHVEKFAYDSLGRKIQCQEFWYKNNAIEDSITTEYHYHEQDNSMLIFYEDGRTEKHIFDRNGRIIEKYEFKDNEQKILEDKYQYQYNEQGKLIREIHFFEEDIKENTSTQRGKIYVYNQRGDLEKMAVLCGCCPHDEKDLSWNEYEYNTYDKQGNWLQKTSVDFSALITIRKIEYYE